MHTVHYYCFEFLVVMHSKLCSQFLVLSTHEMDGLMYGGGPTLETTQFKTKGYRGWT